MFWHFPNGYCQQSALLKNGYKLIYNHPYERQRVELYQLYDNLGKRVDWEEAKDLSQERPRIAESMQKRIAYLFEGYECGDDELQSQLYEDQNSRCGKMCICY